MPTIPAIFLDRVDRTPDGIAFYVPPGADPGGGGQPSAEHPGWTTWTFAEGLRQIAGHAQALAGLGVGPGVPVAILGETSHVWAAADLAVLGLGGITVGIYPTLTGPQVAFQLRHSGARVLLLDGQALFERVAPHLGELPDLCAVRSFWPAPGVPRLEPGPPDVAAWRASAARVGLDDVATYVYTSGTTGDPKAAVLTHRCFDAIIAASREVVPTRRGDRSVVFLPLAHSLQRFALYRGLSEEVTGYYAASIEALPEAIAACRPHVLVTVPRMLEKIRATAEAKAAARGPRAAAILAWAVEVGRARNHLLRRGERVPLALRSQHALAEKLVYQRVRAGLGGSLRTFISGGAALSVDVAEWFEAIGIQVREGWGLTETCAPATLNTEREVRLGTVGRPLPGVELRIDDDGEILVRSPGNFTGYLHDPEATRAAFTADGFFRTGDVGSIDPDGFLRIVDRKKELIVTAGGKNVPPVNVEKRLEGGIVGQAVVVGDGRPYLAALVAPDPDALAALARARGWAGEYAVLAAREEVRALIAARIDEANQELARFEAVRRFAVLTAPLTVEGGELTPTLKLRRREIARLHAGRIEELYMG